MIQGFGRAVGFLCLAGLSVACGAGVDDTGQNEPSEGVGVSMLPITARCNPPVRINACSKFSTTSVAGNCCTCDLSSGYFYPSLTQNIYTCKTGCSNTCQKFSTSNFTGKCCVCSNQIGTFQPSASANLYNCVLL
jgi:hypothetical protein